MPVIEKVSPEQALERVQTALGNAVMSSALNHGQVDVTCSPDSLVAVIEKLRDSDGIRGRSHRVPVVEDGRPVGIVSLGDLAATQDPDSALADISSAPPND